MRYIPELDADAITTGTLALAAGAVLSGTWTPTVTGITNFASTDNIRTCWYYRMGANVICVGNIEVTPTAGSNTATAFSISVPIASNFTGTNNATGILHARRANNSYSEGDIVANSTNDNVELRFGSIDTSSHNVKFVFSYLIA